MQQLSELELHLLNGLTVKYPMLTNHIPHLKVEKRETTGTGLNVYLSYEGFQEAFGNINALFSNQEKIQVDKLKHGLAYVIDVTEGAITSIEFATYNEKWDGKITNYTILENELGDLQFEQ